MKRHSFFLRLFVGNLVIVVLAVGAAALLAYRAFQRQYAEVASAYQENLCRLVARHLEAVWPLSPAEVDRLCKGFLVRPAEGDGEAAEAAVRLTVVAADGTVLGDSRADPAEMTNHRTPGRPEVLAALDGRPGTDLRRSETLGTAFRYVAHPVRHAGGVVAAARVAVPMSVVLRTQALAWEGVVWGGAVAVLAFVLLGLLINWIWSAPLRRLSETARRIAAGDLQTRVEIGGPAELAELGAALEAMRGNLARQVAAVSAEHENLQRVVAPAAARPRAGRGGRPADQ